jgi:penicillin-binding protein 2
MLNSPQQSIFDVSQPSDELIPAGSPMRMWSLGLLFTLAITIIGVRVAWVQTQLPGEYLKSLTSATVEEEVIPARDGRVLAESVILAADVEQYEVQLHYRWLQQNPDPNWLRLQVRQRLSRDERRDEQLVGRTEQEINSQREQVLQSLASATNVPTEELKARCSRIETRVQKISNLVNRRRDEAAGLKTDFSSAGTESDAESDSSSEPGDEADSSEGANLLVRWLTAVRDAVTTPPRRDDADRIVVKEEESWHTVLQNISVETAASISEHPEIFPGVKVTATTQRVYPEHDLAVHIVGARTRNSSGSEGSASAEDETAKPVRNGQFGVEKSYGSLISGIPGMRRTVRDRRQRIVSSEIVRKPVSGRDVTLTIDVKLQTLAEQLLAESLGDAERLILGAAEEEMERTDSETLAPPEPDHIPTGGCILVMEAATGRIVVAASAPEFDLALFTHGTQNQWEAVNSDVRRPFVPRFTGMALPPGSTFKIVTALAGLQSGAIVPDERIDCQGFLNRPDEHRCLIYRLYGRGHGPVNLRTAMAQSCNVYFFDAARSIGIQTLSDWATQLEFGLPTGIDLPFEKKGTLPKPPVVSDAGSEAAQKRFEREALGLSIGQSRLTVTPLQMARLLAFVSNGGWLVTPHVVTEEGMAHTADELHTSPYRVTRRRVGDVRDETLKAIREGLVSAVEDPIGTGYRTVRLKKVAIAGKTGTAETAPGKPDHAWFTGYAPTQNPQYVFVVVLEHGGSGSKAAGPIVRELARSMFQRGMLEEHRLTRDDDR